MINLHKFDIGKVDIRELIIPADKVAHVQIGNPLEHALLVLIKSGYSAVPVLDPSFRLHGLISKTLILDSVLGMERIEMEKLSDKKVEEVMNTKIPRLTKGDPFMKALGQSIDHPFVCVQDDDQIFEGILTRRAILKLFSRMLNQSD